MIKSKNSIGGYLFIATCLIYILVSSYSWLIGYFRNLSITLILFNGLMFLSLFLMNVAIPQSSKLLLSLSLLVVNAIYQTIVFSSVIVGFNVFLTFLPAIWLVLLSKDQKIRCFDIVTKWYCLIIIVGLIIYLFTFFIELPAIGIYRPDDNFYGEYKNFLFYMQPIKMTSIFNRYNGPFLEPGHQSIISAFFLYANKYNVREHKYLWVLIVSVILSFSLAGWLLAIVGYIILNINKIWQFVCISSVLCLVYFFATEVYNGGDNVVNELIIQRLEYDEHKGIRGNNRFYGQTDSFYSKSIENGVIWTGVGTTEQTNKIKGAGYKIFFLRYGILGAIIVLLIYVSFIPKNANKQYAVGFLIFISLCFLQRAYPDWFSWLFPYVLGVQLNAGNTIKES